MNFINCSTRTSIVKTHGCQLFQLLLLVGSLLLGVCANAAETATVKPADEEFDESYYSSVIRDGVTKEKELQTKAADPKTTEAEHKQIQVARVEIADTRERGAAAHPDSYAVQGAAAASAVQAGDWKKGQAYADKAVALAEAKKDPQMIADALRTRAIGAYQAGDYAKATADSKRVLEMFPKDKDARVVYEFSKNRVTAGVGPVVAPPPAQTNGVEAWPAGLPTPSVWTDPRVIAAGERALDRKAALAKLDEAMRRFKMAQSDEDYRAMLAAAQAAQRADPGLSDAYFQKALAWKALKDLAEALTAVTHSISLWTNRGDSEKLPGAYALRSQIRADMGDYPLALSDADKALAYKPDYAAGYLLRAQAGEKIGKEIERAIDDYKRAAELEPDYRDDYEAAVARLADSAKPAPAPPARGRGRFGLVVGGALVLLAALVAVAWKLSRRARPDAVIGFAGERKELDSQYDVVGTLGEGGMGTVYKGWDKVLKRPVAIKRLRAELQANARERDRFLKEAELVGSLHHPHIVDIYTIIRDREDTYLVFEFVSGMTVHDLLNESAGRRLQPKRALEILRQISEAVDHAHSRHVIHRDLKPSNVMLADGGWVKVMDFGIARQVKDSLLTTTNTIVGTPVYMAPEQAMGAVVKESDVFSLGVTLYELLTGCLPYKGPNEMADKMEGRFVAPSILVPNLGAAIDEVVKKALSPRPEERYHRCGELYQAAVRALDEKITPATQR